MIYTARQLQDLHKANGNVTLPVGSRLTPLAQDWLRQKQIVITYGSSAPVAKSASSDSTPSTMRPGVVGSPTTSDAVLWWCDGPCGQAKAAISAQARETRLEAISVIADPKYLVSAIKSLAKEVREGRAAGGVLLVQSGASAVVYANRCKSLRAILGTCRQSVEHGVQHVAANVLVVEHPYQTLSQVRNMLTVFVRGIALRSASDEVKQQLGELSDCE